MVLNFKKIGSVIAVIGMVMVLAFIFWPDSTGDNNKTAELSEYENTDENILPTAPIDPKESLTMDFFAEYRLERERIRGRQIELLREVLSSTTEKEVRQAASLRLVQISQDMEKELQAEGTIKSKGYADCVVIIQSETVLIVVLAESMRLDQEEEIKEIVGKVTGYNEENLCIIYRDSP